MAKPFVVFPDEMSLTVNFSLGAKQEEVKALILSGKLPIKLAGDTWAEGDDAVGIKSHIKFVDVEDNSIYTTRTAHETNTALKYLLVTGAYADLYIKDYTVEVDEMSSIAVIKFNELVQSNPLEAERADEMETVNLHFVETHRQGGIEDWQKRSYYSGYFDIHAEKGEIKYSINFDGAIASVLLVAKVDGDTEFVRKVGERFSKKFYQKHAYGNTFDRVGVSEDGKLTIDATVTLLAK